LPIEEGGERGLKYGGGMQGWAYIYIYIYIYIIYIGPKRSGKREGGSGNRKLVELVEGG
jgi:hypothetical protein